MAKKLKNPQAVVDKKEKVAERVPVVKHLIDEALKEGCHGIEMYHPGEGNVKD
jgi:hypothetical protein